MVTVESPDEKQTTTLLDPTGRLSTIADAPVSSTAFESQHQQRPGRDVAGDYEGIAPHTSPNLLTLPTEIRQSIWKHVYARSEVWLNLRGSGILVYPTTSHECTTPHKSCAEKPSLKEYARSQGRLRGEARRESRMRPAISLALVHPSIYQEVLHFLYASTTFVYDSIMPLECGFRYFHPDAMARVASLKIDAGAKRYDVGICAWKRGFKETIAGLDGLKKLEYITVARTPEGPATSGDRLRDMTEDFLERFDNALQPPATGGESASTRNIDCTIIIEYDDISDSDREFDFSWVPELGRLYPFTIITKKRYLPYKRGVYWYLEALPTAPLQSPTTSIFSSTTSKSLLNSRRSCRCRHHPVTMWPSFSNPMHKMKPPKNKCTLKNDGFVDPAIQQRTTIPHRAEPNKGELTIHRSARISGRRETQSGMHQQGERFSSQQKSLETARNGIDKMRLSESSTKKSSRLLLLPAEIRHQIWKHVYAGTVIMITETGHGVHDPPESAKKKYECPWETSTTNGELPARGILGGQTSKLGVRDYFRLREEVETEAVRAARDRPVHSLALVCRSISKEALSALYSNATFHARNYTRLEKWMKRLHPKSISLVKSLELIGYKDDGHTRHSGEVERAIMTLKQAVATMSGLEKLQCVFSAVHSIPGYLEYACPRYARITLDGMQNVLPAPVAKDDSTASSQPIKCTVIIEWPGQFQLRADGPSWMQELAEEYKFEVIFKRVAQPWCSGFR
ncbi:hypothetical protein KVT40_002145 [Elsinoe batatas]|uniref:DUF7730 domain-containing protein n=1 Tax=Elsinoe batatas TaxID=2601811 RepID=A0A8K0PHX8_9PEZI|nr:hypothetical protein KVT40_002145 [Elsinoe batatas]